MLSKGVLFLVYRSVARRDSRPVRAGLAYFSESTGIGLAAVVFFVRIEMASAWWEDAIEHGRGQDRIAKDILPLGEWVVRGQDERSAF